MSHEAKDQNEAGYSIRDFRPQPDTCPICNYKTSPRQIGLFVNSNKAHSNTEGELEAVYRCANKLCMGIFIAYYKKQVNDNFLLIETKPKSFNKISFSPTIKLISSDFDKIYNEAAQAEQLGLLNICGGGYRKALEFLIKDYLLNKTKSASIREKIKKEFLGKCINTRVKNTTIKAVAKRATWLGNDQIHYVRKWETKDLQDLKKLIELTTHWMEAEVLTTALLTDMPESN